MLIISACLLGINCKYDGSHNLVPRLQEIYAMEELLPLCPEQLGGLPTPRCPAEIQGASGEEVLDGKARVLNHHGQDVTEAFLKGAHETLKLAKLYGIHRAILKARSPSCGCGEIYQGSFTGAIGPGNGVTAALLKRHGIGVYTEENIFD